MIEKIGGYRMDLERHDVLDRLTIPGDVLSKLCGVADIPDTLDLREKIPVRNQQSEGACNGFGKRAVDYLNHLLATGGEPQEFSGDGNYYVIQAIDGIRGDNGSTVSGGVTMAHQVGALRIEDFPETGNYDPGRLPRNYKDLAAPFKCAKTAIIQSDHVNRVKQWLGLGYGGVWWGKAWGFRFDGRGNATAWSASGGGHATAILGYDARGFHCLNSWGKAWQGTGWYYVPYDLFEKVCRHQWTVVAATSDMSEIKPRTIDWVKDSINA